MAKKLCNKVIRTTNAVIAGKTGVLGVGEMALATDVKELHIGDALTTSIIVGKTGIDAVANRPAAGVVGRRFYAEDEDKLYIDTGSAWIVGAQGTRWHNGDLYYYDKARAMWLSCDTMSFVYTNIQPATSGNMVQNAYINQSASANTSFSSTQSTAITLLNGSISYKARDTSKTYSVRTNAEVLYSKSLGTTVDWFDANSENPALAIVIPPGTGIYVYFSSSYQTQNTVNLAVQFKLD